MRYPYTKTTAGFTLLEVMVVIVILGRPSKSWWCLTCWATKRKPIGKKPSAISWRWRMRWILPTG
ncbi:prepilin-type N-terminal cleavage/methylation domain-containing protein [Shigella sonnei]